MTAAEIQPGAAAAAVQPATGDSALSPAAPAETAAGPAAPVQTWSPIVPLIIGCTFFMQTLDTTIIATALPSIARSLDTDPLRLNLAITSYLLSLAVFIPLSGWIADRFGARDVFRAAIAVFTLSSVLCGFAQSMPELVGARILQGMGGAMMVPVGRLVLLKSVPRSDLVRALSYLTMPAMLGPVLGPPLGGFIVTYWSWRWIFFMNVPVGIIGILLVSAHIRNLREPSVPPLDLLGFLLSGVALSALVFGFDSMGRGVLSPFEVLGLMLVGLLCGWLYVIRARRIAHPIIDLTLLRKQTFIAGTIGGGFCRFAIGATPFLLALLLQVGFGLSALQAGLLTFASGAGALGLKFVATPIIRIFGFRRVLVSNAVLSAVFLLLYGLFRPSTPMALIVAALLVGGICRSLLFTTMNAVSYAEVPQPAMSRANSLASMLQQLSLSMGVGIAAVTLDLTTAGHDGAMLTPADCTPAFAVVALLSLIGVWFLARLPANAGEEMRGRSAA